MFKDLNRPEGCYGDHYDKMTRAKDRFVGKPYQPFTEWESEAIKYIVVDELLKELTNKLK
jgi:hypothetical protein